MRGLVHSFGPTIKIFPSFSFRQSRQEKMFGDILDRNKAFLDYKNGQLKNSEIGIFPKGFVHCFGSKKLKFFHLFLLGKIGSKKVLSDILDRDRAFQD